MEGNNQVIVPDSACHPFHLVHNGWILNSPVQREQGLYRRARNDREPWVDRELSESRGAWPTHRPFLRTRTVMASGAHLEMVPLGMACRQRRTVARRILHA